MSHGAATSSGPRVRRRTWATAKGAEKVIDGPHWLNSDGEERNTLVNEAAANAPAGTIFVLVVASGELWKIPPGSDDLISSGVIDEWTNDEYWTSIVTVGRCRHRPR